MNIDKVMKVINQQIKYTLEAHEALDKCPYEKKARYEMLENEWKKKLLNCRA